MKFKVFDGFSSKGSKNKSYYHTPRGPTMKAPKLLDLEKELNDYWNGRPFDDFVGLQIAMDDNRSIVITFEKEPEK